MKKVLKIYKSVVIEIFKTVPYNGSSLKFETLKLHKSPLLIANIVKGAMS